MPSVSLIRRRSCWDRSQDKPRQTWGTSTSRRSRRAPPPARWHRDLCIAAAVAYTRARALSQALIHGLNRHYYSLAINYRKNELEEKMLLNVYKKKWTEGFLTEDFEGHASGNEAVVKEMKDLAEKYEKAVVEEDKLSPEKLVVLNVGRQARNADLASHSVHAVGSKHAPSKHAVAPVSSKVERSACHLCSGREEAPGGERAKAHGVEHRADSWRALHGSAGLDFVAPRIVWSPRKRTI